MKIKLKFVFYWFTLKILNANKVFNTVKDDFKVKSIQPYYNKVVPNKMVCYTQCQGTPGKCCYVQITQQESKMTCELFDYVGNIQYKLEPSPGSLVSTPTNNKRECWDWYKQGYKTDGVYYINIQGKKTKVFCDMTTDGGGWTVFQNRFDGSVDFNQLWDEYKHGFGNINGEHWLGNELIHQFTSELPTTVYVQAVNFSDQINHVKFDQFSIGDESTNYILNAGVYVSGKHQYRWTYMNGIKFSTPDRDNDRDPNRFGYKAGWWFGNCYVMSLNTRLYSIHWDQWLGESTKLKKTRMMKRTMV